MSNAYRIRRHIPAPDHVAIERMAAADLVLAARRAMTLAQALTLDEREQYAKRFEALVDELTVAATCMRKGAPPDPNWMPPFLQPDGPPLPARVYLRVARDAMTHD